MRLTLPIGTRDGVGALCAAPLRLAQGVPELLLAERDRWFLWIPVFFGAGVLFYFGLPGEPPVWLGPILLGGALAGAWFSRGRGFAPVVLGIALAAGGFEAAQVRSMIAAAPVLGEEIGPVWVSGRIVSVGAGTGKQRYVLEHLTIPDLAVEVTPKRARITVRSKVEDGPRLVPGDWVSLRAVLRPPSAPVAPGAWDFARQAWFQGIGAGGYALGPPRLLPVPLGEEGAGIRGWLAGHRFEVAARIMDGAPEKASRGIAAALLTGDRSGMGEDALQAMRDAGLAHLLAISGLHVGLVAGILFAVARGSLALIGPVAVRYNVKKWAAVAALLGALAYVLLAGVSVPTQRAYLMTALVLLAVLLDRTSLSFRLVAVAAVVVLLLAPESLLSPSFQMSFAAAMALIATYETLRRGLTRWASNQTIAMRPTLYLGGVLLTTLVAGLATGPYAMFHFNRIADYGLLANLLAVPITGLWVMPFGLLALALLPIGLEELALVPMGLGIDTVLWISEKVAALPGAVTLVPATSGPVLGLITVGLLWLCIWRRRWRFFGIVPIAVGLTFVVFTRGPDILIEEEARLMAARDASGTLWLSSRQRARFTGQSWLRMGGQESSNAWPHRDGLAESGMRCDTLGCRQRIRGQWVAFVLDARALPEDCTSADVVISVVPIRGGCPSAHTVVDRFDVWRDGGVAIWLEPDGARIANVRETRGNRPWSRPPNK